jgi:hypothetical protein
MEINLVDSNFVGRDMSLNPRFFKWCTKNEQVSNSVFFTDYKLNLVEKLKTKQRKIAWLLEPRAILPEIYDYIEQNFNKFDNVLTFDSNILNSIPNALFCPYGTYWVDDKTNYVKNKNISIIASYKNQTVGHKLRHSVIERLKKANVDIDVYGNHPLYNKIKSKNDALDNYLFSISIENSQQEGYWTEKLLDCFMTKTIPIYWGDKNISQFFDTNGVLFFENMDELYDIIDNKMNDTFYYSKLDTIEHNYNAAKLYKDPEDYIFHNYKYLLT